MQAKRAQAMACLNNGDPREASRLFQEICQTNQNDADAWFMLGAVFGQLGAYREAEQCCRRAVALRPEAFAAWDNLGITLMFQGRNQEAESCFRQALAINPGHAPGHNNLGNLLRTTGQTKSAVDCYQLAIRHNPSYAEACNNLGIALRELGRHREAVESFTQALRLNPDYADAHHNLGDAKRMHGDIAGALHHYREALRINPRLVETHFALGAVMEELNRKDEALACYSQALVLDPNFAKALINRARLIAAQGRHDDAREQLEQARRSNPDNPDVIAELANLAALEGKYRDAYEMLARCIENGTDNLNIALAYAPVSRHTGSPAEAQIILKQLIDDSTLPAPALEDAYFALGKLYEDLGDFDQAFETYQKANDARFPGSDIEKHLQEFAAIQAFFTPDTLASLPRADNNSSLPVFIVGMPRSGTSLVEQILAAHPLVHGGGELTELWKIMQTLPEIAGNGQPYPACLQSTDQQQLSQAANRYLDFLSGLDRSAQRVTDKLPHNFLHLGLIQLLFPGTRVIECIRDPRDTCLSIYSHKFNASHLYAHRLEDLGIYYRQYQILMEHWKEVLDIPILEVDYRQLVTDPVTGIHDLLAFCGLPWDEQCLSFHTSGRVVYTPSRDQVRQPVYTRAIGRWKNFSRHLGPLLATLEQEIV